MRTRSLSTKLIAVSAAAVLTLAACGSDDDATDTTPDTTEAPAEAGTIVDIAAGNPSFSTLVTAVTEADLVETLSGDGPFTVFAPTNDAFDALPAGTLDELLLPENQEALAGILTYHVVAGSVMAADLSDGQEVETVAGGTLTVGIDGDAVTLTDENGGEVNVVDTDIEASNGVIHVIDGVLLPASDDAPAEGEEAAGTIVDIASGNDDFSTLVAAVTAAELGETLSGEGPFTVFAPTNDAFDALPEGTLDSLLEAENLETLQGILTYHVVAGAVMSTDLSDGQEVETVNGEILTVSISDSGVTLTDASGATVNVVDVDIEASNGVIHVIDGVLLPA